jgi:hypothetical protein
MSVAFLGSDQAAPVHLPGPVTLGFDASSGAGQTAVDIRYQIVNAVGIVFASNDTSLVMVNGVAVGYGKTHISQTMALRRVGGTGVPSHIEIQGEVREKGVYQFEVAWGMAAS